MRDVAAEDEDLDWVYLSEQDLESDLAEGEEALVPAAACDAAFRGGASEEELRLLLRQGALPSTVDAGALFAAGRELHAAAADLHGALEQVESLQFSSALLVAAVSHGPLRPPALGSESLSESADMKLFSDAAAPLQPPDLELDPPAGASTLADYHRRLSMLPKAIAIRRPVRMRLRDVNRHQDEKDINRDELLVNGKAISGARQGYAVAVAELRDALLTSAGEGEGAEHFSAQRAEQAAELLLSTLNRTSSGGASFEEVLQLFTSPDVVLVAPDSAAARPLEAVVFGGYVLGRAHTRYSLRIADGSGDPLAVVDAVYTFRVGVEELRCIVADSDAAGEEPETATSAASPQAAVLLTMA